VADVDIDNVVPQILQNIGGSNVDFSEIASVLSQAGEALDLVRSSSYGGNLANIAYIYNTSEGGAFGVFDPNIDHSVKIKIVESKLREIGYEVDYKNGELYAWAPGKSAEEVRSEMESMYNDLDLHGGLVIGINASKIYEVSMNNFNDLKTQVNEQIAAGNSAEPIGQDDFNQMVALHLGSTIVHETVHALGAKGEDEPIKAQRDWTQETIQKINAEREAQGKFPLEMSDNIYNASSFKKMMRMAQIGYQDYMLPEAFLRMFVRFNDAQFPVDKGANDSLETILNKNEHSPIGADFILENELSKEHTDTQSEMMSIEELLEEDRPRPLIVPISKTAGINSNVGGPYISSAFAVDEWLPRVLDGRDITDRIEYQEGEDPYWQRRYKPENVSWTRDRFGNPTYKYDQKFQIVDYNTNNPMSWNQLFREDNVTGPWRKMASSERGESLSSLLCTLGKYKSIVRSGKRKAVRLIMPESMFDFIIPVIADMRPIVFSNSPGICSVWMPNEEVGVEEMTAVENSLESMDNSKLVNSVLGSDIISRDRINYILSVAKEICLDHGIPDVYVVGGLPRNIVSGESFVEVNDLDFTGTMPYECHKLGGLLAEELNADDMSIFHRTMTMSFSYDGLKMDFRGNFMPLDIRPLMRRMKLKVTPMSYDIYARDFTVNSLLYDFINNKIYDVSKHGVEDVENRRLRTLFSPDEVICANPLIITRAIVMSMRGYSIDPELAQAMRDNKSCLFNGSISDIRLTYEYEKIAGYSEGDSMLKEFGISNLKEIAERIKTEEPDLFEEN